jgi:hypothetical protein
VIEPGVVRDNLHHPLEHQNDALLLRLGEKILQLGFKELQLVRSPLSGVAQNGGIRNARPLLDGTAGIACFVEDLSEDFLFCWRKICRLA